MGPAIIISVAIVCVTVALCFHIVCHNKRMAREHEINAKLALDADRDHYEFLKDK